MEIILDNAFSSDTLARRAVRLLEVESKIAALDLVLTLPIDVKTWADTCHTEFVDLVTDADVEEGEKEGAFLAVSEATDIMDESYADIRLVGMALYEGDPTNLKDFNFNTPFPKGTNAQLFRVRDVVKVTEIHRAAGVTHTLTIAMTDRLTANADAVEAAYDEADMERYESEHATAGLWARMTADATMLRTIYSWARAAWGRYDLRFELLGMVPSKKRGGGQPDEPTGFVVEFVSPTLTLSCDPVETATSYQFMYSDDGSSWEELYAGSDTTCNYEPPVGTRQYKCRARNANGFGDFSETLSYTVPQ